MPSSFQTCQVFYLLPQARCSVAMALTISALILIWFFASVPQPLSFLTPVFGGYVKGNALPNTFTPSLLAVFMMLPPIICSLLYFMLHYF
jgi:hypothetical protein